MTAVPGIPSEADIRRQIDDLKELRDLCKTLECWDAVYVCDREVRDLRARIKALRAAHTVSDQG